MECQLGRVITRLGCLSRGGCEQEMRLRERGATVRYTWKEGREVGPSLPQLGCEWIIIFYFPLSLGNRMWQRKQQQQQQRGGGTYDTRTRPTASVAHSPVSLCVCVCPVCVCAPCVCVCAAMCVTFIFAISHLTTLRPQHQPLPPPAHPISTSTVKFSDAPLPAPCAGYKHFLS